MKNLKTKLSSLLLLIFIFLVPASALAATDPCANTNGTNGSVNQTKVDKCVSQSPVVQKIQTVVDLLSAGVGIVVVGVIIVGGIQYSLAGDNANAVTAAKQRMINGVIALFIFLFAFAFLQWLIPGGVFK